MALKDFFYRSPMFNPRYNLAVHIIQLVLIITAVVLTFVRMTMNVPRTRANTMALSMVSIPFEPLVDQSTHIRKQ